MSITPEDAAARTVALAEALMTEHPTEGRRLLYVAADFYNRAGLAALAESCRTTAKKIKKATHQRHRPGLAG